MNHRFAFSAPPDAVACAGSARPCGSARTLQPSRAARPAGQRGATLIEALIAFMLAVVATVGAGQAAQQLRLHADVARQRTEAVRLAGQAIEALRAAAAAASGAGWAAIAGRSDAVDGANARYSSEQRVADGRGAKVVSFDVDWADRSGVVQAIRIDAQIAADSPGHSAALALAGNSPLAAAPYRRHAGIPPSAASLGDGRSVWRPAPGDAAGRAIVFDDRSGEVLAQCAGLQVAAAMIRAADLTGCSAGRWLVASGVVRSTGGPLPATVDLTRSDGGPAPLCSSDAVKTVRTSGPGGIGYRMVAVDAAPTSIGAVGWSDTGDRYTAWRCLVAVDAGGAWSGRIDVRPSGWTIGAGAGAHRVCRHANDRDGDGAVAGNGEHPAAYAAVGSALTAQNFLVVGGDVDCAAAAPTAIAHQP